MEALPDDGLNEECIPVWAVREVILNAGGFAAAQSKKYEQALEFNDEVLKLTKARGANELELTRTAFNDYGPLLSLERYDEAENLLWTCKYVYERENYLEGLGRVFGALADLIGDQGRIKQAVKFEEDALRYSYLAGRYDDVSRGHYNLVIYLGKMGSVKKALAHLLAVSLIDLIVFGKQALSLRKLSIALAKFGPDQLPASFDQLCETVEEVEGVRFRDLFIQRAGPDADGDAVMQTVLQMAQEMERGEVA